LGISKSAYYYYLTVDNTNKDIADLHLILAVLMEIPFYGYRKVSKELMKTHAHLTRKRVRRIMRRFGKRAIYPGPRLSVPGKGHKKYPYLLRNKIIRYPNQVWATDISYISLPGGHVYLVAIIDLYSRRILSWRLSNTMDVSFCLEALNEAIEIFGIPAIFNSDQGSQFTSDVFTERLKNLNIEISMDGKGRALDNIFIERLWRSLKYEDIYLRDYQNMSELKEGVKKYFIFYNERRIHESLDYGTPKEIFESVFMKSSLPLAA